MREDGGVRAGSSDRSRRATSAYYSALNLCYIISRAAACPDAVKFLLRIMETWMGIIVDLVRIIALTYGNKGIE